MDARGGTAASTEAGSGSGGRVAFYFDESQYRGVTQTEGGSGSNPGGAGSTYLRQQLSEFKVWETLVIDNNNHGWDVPYVFGEGSKVSYEFHEVHILNHAAVLLSELPW